MLTPYDTRVIRTPVGEPDRFEKAALEFVNQVRAVFGKEPLDSLRPEDVTRRGCCPIINSIGLFVTSRLELVYPVIKDGRLIFHSTSMDESPPIEIPQDVLDFRKRFRLGIYPRYQDPTRGAHPEVGSDLDIEPNMH